MKCFWEHFILGCTCIVVCLGVGFVFTQTDSLQDIPTAEHDLHYTPFQHSDQCMQISAHCVCPTDS